MDRNSIPPVLKSTLWLDSQKFNQEVTNAYGFGAFTTLIPHTLPHRDHPVFFKFDWHIERLFSNAESLAIDFDPRAVAKQIEQTLQSFDATKLRNTVVKLVIKEGDLCILIDTFQPSWKAPFSIALHPLHVERSLPEIKSLSSAASVYARKIANKNSCHEALLIDRDGFVREGAWSNFFWVTHSGQICTAEKRVLPGITRRFIIETEKCSLKELSYDQLLEQASEAFITQSTNGITPVAKIGTKLLTHSNGPVTQMLSKNFTAAVNTLSEPLSKSIRH